MTYWIIIIVGYDERFRVERFGVIISVQPSIIVSRTVGVWEQETIQYRKKKMNSDFRDKIADEFLEQEWRI